MIEPTNYRQNWRKTKYPNLWVSDNGEVWNARFGKTRKLCITPKGISILVYHERKNKRLMIARLVYETFKGEIPNGYIVAHKDNIITNNFIGNLVLMNKPEFTARNNKLNTGRKVEIRNKDGEVIKRYNTITEYCQKNYISTAAVDSHISGRVKNSTVIPKNAHFLPRGYKEEI